MTLTYTSVKRAALTALFVLVGSSLPAQGPPATLVKTEPVIEREFHDQITLIGRTEARITSRIVSEVTGRVVSIDAAEGNPVKKGAALVTIDTSRIVLALRSKQAEAEQARQQAFLAEQNHKRVEELYSQSLVPQSTIDSARAWAISAEARYGQLDAERAKLALDLDQCTIRAPYSGYTLRRTVDVGEWVNMGTPVFEMIDLSSITVTVDLPERYYGQLSIGSPVGIETSNLPGETLTGTVTGIARSAASETHTFPVIIQVPNGQGSLGGGKLVRSILNLNNQFTSLAVSKDAVVRDGSRTMLYTIHDGAAAPIMVQVMSADGEMVAVKGEGLVAGMPVVVRGNERIYPGAPVRTDDGANEDAGKQQLSQRVSD